MFDDGLFSGMYEMHDHEKAAEEATLASLSTERYLELARKCCYVTVTVTVQFLFAFVCGNI